VEDQGESETNEQRIFYLHLFMKSGQRREETFVKAHPIRKRMKADGSKERKGSI